MYYKYYYILISFSEESYYCDLYLNIEVIVLFNIVNVVKVADF